MGAKPDAAKQRNSFMEANSDPAPGLLFSDAY